VVSKSFTRFNFCLATAGLAAALAAALAVLAVLAALATCATAPATTARSSTRDLLVVRIEQPSRRIDSTRPRSVGASADRSGLRWARN
jgi:hypothetical protein